MNINVTLQEAKTHLTKYFANMFHESVNNLQITIGNPDESAAPKYRELSESSWATLCRWNGDEQRHINKIEAIKLYRELTGSTLMEAKNFIDKICERDRELRQARSF